ncbi:MAG: transglycosylase SLT domain-containing protein [Synergistaceae bacterium]|jgi:soluble lytic murein transglycosylase|nr:transglycosylase SLT domain-containing protein [Synergistaceae bacterium]
MKENRKKSVLRRYAQLMVEVLFLLLALLYGGPARAGEISLSELFRKRSWAAMDEVYRSGKKLTPKDHSLMANALRIQNRWNEAVEILERQGASFPAEVSPYANMTLLLGYENQKRIPEALKVADRLEKNAPAELRYYAAWAQVRLLGNERPEDTKKALNRMLTAADSNERKIFTLTRMIELPGDQRANALKLLELQPTNKAGRDLLAARPKPWSAAENLALGHYAYLKNDYKTAFNLLSEVPQKSPGWRKATYYRAFALYQMKRYAEALNLWGNLALRGNGWAESSVRRIATLAGRAEKANAIATLRKIIKERKGKVQARAMFALAGLVEAEEAKKLENDLVSVWPDSPNALKILWKRGWESWSAKNHKEALWYWKQLASPGLNASWRPRVLYWTAALQKAAGRHNEAEKTLNTLIQDHPLSSYAFWARPGAITLLPGDPPALASKPGILEEWGFIYYAKLKMQRPGASAKELYRSIALSEWLGETDGSYTQARLLSRWFGTGTKLYRRGLECLYPRPFKKQVDEACETYGVEDNFVWSIMRQESAFRPEAVSWAGASGLMQLMPGTAKDEAKHIGLKQYNITDVKDNITMGTSHLARLRRSFDREDWIMAAYNAGSGNARKWLADGGQNLKPDQWIERVRFDETCDYVQKVSGNLAVYRMLYGERKTGVAKVKISPAEDETLPSENLEGESSD